MRALIMGCGRLTTMLVPVLAGSGFQIVILGQHRTCLEAVADEPKVEVVLTTEPFMQDYLQQGGINNADVFLALSADDHQNALTAQIARHIFNVPKVVCLLDSPELQRLYADLGLNVVSPTQVLLEDVRQAMEK